MIERWGYTTRFLPMNYGDFCRIARKTLELYQRAYLDGEIIQEVTLYSGIPSYTTYDSVFPEDKADAKNAAKISKVCEIITKQEFNEAKYIEVHYVPSMHKDEVNPFMCSTWKGRHNNLANFYAQGDLTNVTRVSLFSRSVYTLRYALVDGYKNNASLGLI